MKISSTNPTDLQNSSSIPIKEDTATLTQPSLVQKPVEINEMTDEQGKPTEQAIQTAVNKLNEFMEYSQRNSKFIFHQDLERYYVEVVDAQSQEVIKEVPPKELLDAYYEMQKLVGKIFDTQA